MKKVVLFRNQLSKQSPKYTQVTDYLNQLNISFSESELTSGINNHHLNYFFVPTEELLAYLEINKPFFKFGFSNHLVIDDITQADEIVHSTYRFRYIYCEIPSLEQFKLDLFQANEVSLDKIKQHIKVYFTGYLLESIVHELNNPLSSVTLNCQLILEMIENNVEFKEGQLELLVSHTLKSITQSSDITKTVLRYASNNADENDYFNLPDVLKNIYLFTAPLFRKKQLKLQFPEGDDYLVYANPSDTSLLFVILFYIISKTEEKGAHIVVEYQPDHVSFSLNQEFSDVSDLYNELFIPAFYVDLTFEEIVHKNGIRLSVDTNKIQIFLPHNASDEPV